MKSGNTGREMWIEYTELQKTQPDAAAVPETLDMQPHELSEAKFIGTSEENGYGERLEMSQRKWRWQNKAH